LAYNGDLKVMSLFNGANGDRYWQWGATLAASPLAPMDRHCT
jgi:hypothetical protein